MEFPCQSFDEFRRLKTVVRMRHTFGRDKNRHYFGSAVFFSIKGEEEVDYMYNNFCRFGRFRKVTDLSQSHGSSMAVHV